MKKCLLLILCLVSSLMASAESGTCGDNLTWSLEDGLLVISGTGAMANYDDWSTYAPWYSYRSRISLAIISEGVTSIGDYAFYGCSGLSSITIPNSVTNVGSWAFSGCSGLTSITIPNSVTSIGIHAFYGCSGLTSVNIKDLARWCGVDFGDYYANPINYAHKLELNGTEIKDLVIPEGVTEIKGYVFFYNNSLVSVTIPNSVVSIGRQCFSQNRNLTSITIPNSVTNIGDSAFSNDAALTSVTIPESITSIGNTIFYGCSSLTSISIPNSVTSIGDGAFQYCNALTSVTIPNSVTSIGEDAFSGCTNVNELIYEDGCITTLSTGLTGITSVVIPNSVTSIGDYAFWNCSDLTSITIPNSVTNVGSWAFYCCSGLTSITIPNSVTSIGASAFQGCSGLTSVNITDLAAWCNIDFSNCASNPTYSAKDRLLLNGEEITDLVIPDGVTKIKNHVFRDCFRLTSATIPNTVTSIGESFRGCIALKSMTIPSSVTSIGSFAFYDCWELSSISVLSATPPTVGSSFLGNAGTSIIHVYEGLADVYKAASGWSSYTFADDIPVIRVTGLSLDATRYACAVGQRFTPQVVAYAPEDATWKEVTWSSSDPSTLAIVPTTGACIGLKDGVVTITAIAKDADHASVSATVYVGNSIPEDAVTISVSSANTEMGTVSGGGVFLPGAVVTLTATPAGSGYIFQSWSDGSTENPYTFTATESKEFIANFGPSYAPQIIGKTKAMSLKPNQWYVITQNRMGESPAYEDVANSRVMRAATSVDVHVGDYFGDVKNYLVRFLPTNNKGIYKLQWGTDHYWFTTSSTSYGAAGITVQTVTDEANAGNYFVYNINGEEGHFGMNLTRDNSTYGLIVDNNGAGYTVSFWGTGKVTSLNGNNDWTFYEVEISDNSEIEITATCETEQGSVSGSGIYARGTEVTLTATPAEGYKFVRWSDGSTENPYTFVATTDMTLTAEFIQIELTLIDGEAYTNTTEETYDYVSYTRTFDDTEWQALYVPFKMSYEDWCDDFEVAKVNMFHQYDTDDDGNFDKLELEIVKVKSGTLIANHPYLIKALNSGEKTITLESATLYPAEENSFVCNSMETTYTFTGTYAGVSGADMYTNHYYSMGGGSLIYAEDATAALKPYRWYLKMTDREGQVIPAPSQIRVMEWNGQTTAVDGLSLDKAPVRAMSLDGRCVKDVKARGLYIVNGKKVLR